MMKYITLTFLILFLLECGDKEPEFKRGLSRSSVPQEGILPYFRGEVMDPYWPRSASYPDDLRRMDNFNLISHKGASFGPEQIRGKYTLVNFFFASCHGICPLITHNVKKLSAKINDQSDVQFLSLTVNPERDNPEIINGFREMNKVTQKNWTFLTGSKDAIYKIARKEFGAEVKLVRGEKDLTDFVHTENVYLLDKNGYLRGLYRARGTADLDRLVQELETLRSREPNSNEI